MGLQTTIVGYKDGCSGK